MKKLFLVAIIWLIGYANEAILELDTKGHTGIIRDIITTRDGNIISASDDKTIKVWSSGGKLLRRIDGAIGAGSEGMVYAIALSPDEQVLAVGGYLNNNGNYEYGNIRLYDYATGHLTHLLKAHTNAILDLAFSANGRYLASGSADKSVRLWDMGSFSSTVIATHDDAVYGVKFIGENIISAGDDNTVMLHDRYGNLIKSYTHTAKLRYIATNGNHIAVSGGVDNAILIFDANLNLIQTITSPTNPTGLSYSPDGSKLVAGIASSPFQVIVYKSTNYKPISTMTSHDNAAMALAWLDNNTVVSGGGNQNTIYIWRPSKTPNILTTIEGKGRKIWSVGIKGDTIAWGNIFDYVSHNDRGKLQKSFNLQTHEISDANANFNRINSTGLSHSKGGNYGYDDATLTIASSKASITKDAYTGYGHRCYGWYKDYIVSGGSNGHLKIYDKQGNEVASLVGHTGTIWSIGLDGDRLVSGSSDQTIKMWDLSLLRGAKHSVEYNEELISAIIKATNWTREEVIAGADFIKQKTQLSIYKNNSIVIHPTLSLFVANDDEWVMWTPDGFFDSSPNGAKYIGYHINQGSDKEAQFVSVDRLYNTFYRPDLITKALAGESLASYAKDINIAKLLEGGLAPKVAILTKGGTSSSRDVELNLQVCDNGGGYENLTLLLNGMNIDVIGGDRALKAKTSQKGACFTYSKLISLTSGQNTIGFKATNRTGTIESDTQEITLSYKQAITSKPNLYVLSLAVDKYRDGDLQLKYSVADGDGIIDTLSKVGKNLFGSVNITKLRDKEVTKAGILKAFEDIGAKTTREDVFILHIAGHGITEPKSGEYYYLPVDFRYKNESSVAQQGFSRSDFTQGLSKIQAMKSLSLLDTCNSGSFAEAVASRGILQKTAIDRLTRATGRATIVASSKDQVALEGYKGHGVFTYTLIEALESAGYAGDNQITIKELASYVERILPDRTYEKWGYEQIPQSNITGNDFPIGMK